MDFIGIAREAVFSPGKVDADAEILRAVADELIARGSRVRVATAAEALGLEPQEPTRVFAMCQGDAALARLQEWEARGVRVVNRPLAILRSQRFRALPLLQAAGLPLPQTILTTSDDQAIAWAASALPVWVKRGDVHATEPDDVVCARTMDAVGTALARFRARGIGRVVLQRHVAGAVCKFYATGGGFFRCMAPPGVTVDAATAAAMARMAARAAAALELGVYGGDCVLGDDGALSLIDLNDWPSYGPCRAQAAAAIAVHLLAQKESPCG